tara:strand:+ start:3079 stop:4458 length:1380 start_codon:yes stop_codon:yes gene_type:complete
MIFSNAEQVVKDSIESLKAINRDKMYEQQDMCIDYYQFNNTKKYIKKYFSGTLQQEIPLYCVNMTKRLINRISLCYKNPPERVVENEDYQEYTKDKNFTLKRIERIHNLLGTVALQIVWNDGQFNYIPRIEFEPVFSPDDPMNPIGLVYPAQKTTDSIYQTQEDEFVYWDNERHFRFDAMGNIIHINEGDINPYGALPFVFLQPNHQIDEFRNVGQGLDICQANCQLDIAMTMLQHHIRKAGGQFVIQGQVQTNNIELGLNKVVVLDDGTMTNLNPNVNIQAIIDGIKFQLQQVAINHHLSFDFGISGSKSGVALKVENVELLESREDDIEKFRRLEKEIYKKEQVILSAEINRTIADDFSVDFAEIDFPDFEREREEWDWKFKHGIADIIDYMIYQDPDRFGTDDKTARPQWEDYLAERKRSGNIVANKGTEETSVFNFGKAKEPKIEKDNEKKEITQ